MPCQNGGKCQQNGNFYVCLCINDYIGKNCEVKNTNSTILTNETTVVLNSLAGFVFKSLNLIYRASRDGFRAIDFHSKCDNTSNTFTLIKTKKSYIFGGYTTLSWNESGARFDKQAFLVSLKNKNYDPIKLDCRNDEPAIYSQPEIGPVFGKDQANADIYIVDQSNVNNCSCTPSSYFLKSNESLYDESFLAGEKFFNTEEIEVFEVRSIVLGDSSILNQEMIPILLDLAKFEVDSWQIIYRASVDGFSAADFHRKCDSIPNTFILIKTTKSFVFGGFTTKTWNSESAETDEDAFLISLVNYKNDPVRLKSTMYSEVYNFESNYGPIFGSQQKNSADIWIVDKPNINNCSCSPIGNFLHLNGSFYEENLLAGERYFMTEEIEVYVINNPYPNEISPENTHTSRETSLTENLNTKSTQSMTDWTDLIQNSSNTNPTLANTNSTSISVTSNLNTSSFTLNTETTTILPSLNTSSTQFSTNNYIFLNSTILTDRLAGILLDLTKFEVDSWQIIYRASVDGFSAADFHRKCDSIPNTFTLIETTNSYIFGGFTSKTWDSEYGSETDEDAFLISLVNYKNDPVRLKSTVYSEVYNFESYYGPIFGSSQKNSADIWIVDEPNINQCSCFPIGNFLHLNGSFYEENLLAGERYFKTDEIEVYKIN